MTFIPTSEIAYLEEKMNIRNSQSVYNTMIKRHASVDDSIRDGSMGICQLVDSFFKFKKEYFKYSFEKPLDGGRSVLINICGTAENYTPNNFYCVEKIVFFPPSIKEGITIRCQTAALEIFDGVREYCDEGSCSIGYCESYFFKSTLILTDSKSEYKFTHETHSQRC